MDNLSHVVLKVIVKYLKVFKSMNFNHLDVSNQAFNFFDTVSIFNLLCTCKSLYYKALPFIMTSIKQQLQQDVNNDEEFAFRLRLACQPTSTSYYTHFKVNRFQKEYGIQRMHCVQWNDNKSNLIECPSFVDSIYMSTTGVSGAKHSVLEIPNHITSMKLYMPPDYLSLFKLPPHLVDLHISYVDPLNEVNWSLPNTLQQLAIEAKLTHPLVPGSLPQSLTTLLISVYPFKLQENVLPCNLEKLTIRHYCYALDSNTIPKSIKSLVIMNFVDTINQPLQLGELNNLEYLLVGSNYNLNIERGMFPTTLKKLYIGKTNTDANDSFPESIENLTVQVLKDFNGLPRNLKTLYTSEILLSKDNIQSNSIPPNLKRLEVSSLFIIPPELNRNLYSFYPPSLTHMKISLVKLEIEKGIFPPTLTHLELFHATSPIPPNSLPESLQYLSFMAMDSEIEPFELGSLPPYLKFLKLYMFTEEKLDPSVIPLSITNLEYGNYQFIDNQDLPPNLERLSILNDRRGFNQNHNGYILPSEFYNVHIPVNSPHFKSLQIPFGRNTEDFLYLWFGEIAKGIMEVPPFNLVLTIQYRSLTIQFHSKDYVLVLDPFFDGGYIQITQLFDSINRYFKYSY